MELIVLGSGGYALGRSAAGIRHPAGYAVRMGRRLMVFDLGFGDLRQLARAGLDPADVGEAFFTHRHPDHVGDLAALLFFFRYERRPRSGALRLHGPTGMRAFLGGLRRSFSPWLDARGYRCAVRELADGARAAGPGWSVRAASVPHPTPSLAYRLHCGGRSLVYTGDTGYDPRLAEFAAGCDLLVIECSTTDRRPAPGIHLSVSEALRVVELSRCRRAVLSHLSGEAEAELRARGAASRRVLLARDLMRVGV
ncbi:MAG: MBL fold metallo-hydrolase [Elusimicrobia bacterium]|nr:MBL fold metallo-hydrolase [Elusimicrobiota bacterium]